MSKKRSKLSPAMKIMWVILFAILAYFLWMEHRAHVIAYLPMILLLLVLLLCPLMHLFMHHGHGGRNHDDDKSDRNNHHKHDRRND